VYRLCVAFFIFFEALVPIAIGIKNNFSFGSALQALLIPIAIGIGRVSASRKGGTGRAVFNCACKLRWLFIFLFI
jgi:hypothetical protein